MNEVEELFPALPNPQTRVWIGEHPAKEFSDFKKKKENPPEAFQKKLKRYSVAGFKHYEGKDDGKPIKEEWGKVWRISDGGLYRLIGFYEDCATKRDFIILDAFLKHGHKLTAPERNRIDAVVEIRASGNWAKKKSNGPYPRLAE